MTDDNRRLSEYPRYERETRTLIVSPQYFDHMQRLSHLPDETAFEDLQRSLCAAFRIASGTEVKVKVVPYD